jgi:TldD protein
MLREQRREFQVEWLPRLWQDEATMPFRRADEMAELALKRVAAAGAEYGDVRIVRSMSQTIRGEDRRIDSIRDVEDSGFGVRVLYHGGWGFAASSVLSQEEVPRVADLAVEIARGSASLANEKTRLVDEPVHRDHVVTRCRVDPFAVPLEQKTTLLQEVMDAVQRQPEVVRSRASLWAQRDRKLFASTEGTRLEFDLMAVQGEFTATARHEDRFASRSFATPHLRTGYESIEAANFAAHAPRIATQAVEKVAAPAVRPGLYDLVLDPEHLALTMHESCGHPSELDRALGYEANYAGTSFLTPEKRGTFRYGSRHVNLIADNTEPETLAATGYDDDGVACQRWDIVREGVFVGYCTNREVASKIGETRSRGSSRADSWGCVPIVRIANIGLEPGTASLDDLVADVKRGIYIEGHGSYSIDQRRYNFQFGGDAFWLIENGRRTTMLRDVIYHGITPEFWNSCDGVADPRHRRRYGFITCGKGQPGQAGWMTHAASHARFRRVAVIKG